MESALCVIASKPTDYVICKECRHINWYENEHCIDCKHLLKPHKDYTVEEWVEDEYEFWADEGWTQLLADELRIEV